jgi:hypothetical protein
MTGFKARSWVIWHCDPMWDDRCDDLPCRGHRVTRDIDQAARVLAWADGYDSLDESDQVEEYYTMGARALRDMKKPAATR